MWQWFGFPCRVVPRVHFGHDGQGTGALDISWLGGQLCIFWGEAAQACASSINPMSPAAQAVS